MIYYQIFLIIILYVIFSFIIAFAISSFLFLVIAYLNLKHLHRVISFIDFCNLIKKYIKTDTHSKINNTKEKEFKLDSFKRTNYENKDTFSPYPLFLY
jgi:hypothetical protein